MNETRLSFGLKIMVLLVVLSEQTVLFIIPSLIIYMIDHLTKISEIETTPELIGNYLALIEGLNRGFIIIGGLIWGYLSDKTNRKFCLALSITCFSFTSLGFGLSSSLESAIFWRVFSGLSSGSINILKATIPDLTTDENISELYKFFSAGFGVASILGPLLAGFFSSPSKNFLIFQNSSFFQSYPYFLPFLIK
jgi:MFS family permease